MILPNQLTVLRIILTPIFLFFFLYENQVLKEISLIVFLVAALTDWYDGWLARKFNYITSWGKFWDPLADKILTSSAFFGFAMVGLIANWMVWIIILRDLLITLLRVYSDYRGFSFRTSVYAKIKTVLQMIFLYYLLIFFVLSKNDWFQANFSNVISLLLDEDLLFFLSLFITAITFFTGLQYIFANKNLIKKLFQIEN
ncbi:MAG TPA: CDP-diacylglycerol--glycerol-3-phosphate 3-phosphatidyltransferase [Ignavibacteriaceae bacterium]|nr:CDP-diacylglycerol--glycerol-3-phosphate 3-phosphatidyltransferase [Ignavibacteriaceae bacterium]